MWSHNVIDGAMQSYTEADINRGRVRERERKRDRKRKKERKIQNLSPQSASILSLFRSSGRVRG